VFVSRCLNEIFYLVNQKQPEIFAEILSQLPTEMQHSQIDKENPFALYCSYLDRVRPIEIKDNCDNYRE